MYSLRKILASLCRARQSLGFGVHSPFVYQLIVDVFYERLPYYSYSCLMQVKPVRRLPGCSIKINKLLFRLINYFQPSDIMEFGTGNGMSVVWMSYAKKCNSIVTYDKVDSCDEDKMKEFFSQYLAIKYVPILSLSRIEAFLEEKDSTLNFVHIAHTDKYKEIFELLLNKVDSDSIIVIENINNPLKRKWWKGIERNERTVITIDLYDVGIVLFDRNHTKRAYKLIF